MKRNPLAKTGDNILSTINGNVYSLFFLFVQLTTIAWWGDPTPLKSGATPRPPPPPFAFLVFVTLSFADTERSGGAVRLYLKMVKGIKVLLLYRQKAGDRALFRFCLTIFKYGEAQGAMFHPRDIFID